MLHPCSLSPLETCQRRDSITDLHQPFYDQLAKGNAQTAPPSWEAVAAPFEGVANCDPLATEGRVQTDYPLIRLQT
nr:MAG TPA: hypothetical protein [Caudoviricetes sp.]